MEMTQFLQRFVVCAEDELLALEVLVEVVYPLDNGGSLQQERRVILFMVFQLSRCKLDGVELAVFIHLGEEGPEASGCVGRARGRIRDQSILAVNSGEGHYWFRDELFPEVDEGIHGCLWQRTSFVSGILQGEPEQWCGNDRKVLDVSPEKVAQAYKRSDHFDISWCLGGLDCLELVLAWLDSFWS
jgi:hypothetical protein